MRNILMRQIYRLVLTGVCGLFLLMGGCTQKNDTAAPHQPEPVSGKITICQGGALAILPLIAMEQGFFAGKGLAVEIVAKGDGKLAMDAMLAGECTFATCGEPPLVAGRFNRSDFVVLASLNMTNNATKIIARKDFGIRTVADLKGRAVGVRKGTFSHYFLDMLLMKNAIRPQEVTLRFMESGVMAEALQRGEIVAYSGSDEPLLKGMKLLGNKALILSDPELCLNSVSLVTKKDFAASRPDIIRKLLSALLQAEEFIAKHPDETREIVQRLKGFPPAELDSILKEQNHRVTSPQSLLLTLEGNARWQIDNKMVPVQAVPNFLDVINAVPLKSLKPSAVTLNR